MKKIDSVIRKVVGGYGITQQAESAYICFLANKISSDKFKAESFKNGILILQVKNPYLAQEIQFNQQKIIFDLNKKIGTQKVQRIRFRIRKND